MAQRLVTITLPEADALRVVDMLLSFSWISNLDVSTSTRCIVCKNTRPSRLAESLRGQPSSSWAAAAARMDLERPLLPNDEPMEKLLQVAKIQFKVRATHLGATVKALKSEGVGSLIGILDVSDVRVSTEALPVVERKQNRFCRSLTDRLSTLEMHETMVSASHLNADHVACVVIASCIAAVGLVTDGTVDILASFFVSPLMTMLLGACWGMCVGDYKLTKRAFRNLVYDAMLCIVMGYVVSLMLGIVFPHRPEGVTAPVHFGQHGVWNAVSVSTSEILNRGPPASNIVFSSIVASFSGVAVALGHTGGLPSALAGVALSTSLLPPLVNTGLMFGLAQFYPNVKTSRGDKLITVGCYSGMIYLVNITCVFIFAFFTLKFKRVGGVTLKAAKRDFAASKEATDNWQQNAASTDAINDNNLESSITTTLLAPLVGKQLGQISQEKNVPTVNSSDDNDEHFRVDDSDHRLSSLSGPAYDSAVASANVPSGGPLSSIGTGSQAVRRHRDFLDLDDVASLPSEPDLCRYSLTGSNNAFSEEDNSTVRG